MIERICLTCHKPKKVLKIRVKTVCQCDLPDSPALLKKSPATGVEHPETVF
jgi:hypothetical protein